MSGNVFQFCAEKKPRSHNSSSINMKGAWKSRNFTLKGQEFSYSDNRDNKKGSLTIRESDTITILNSSQADGKLFAFALVSEKESITLSVETEGIMKQCVKYLLFAKLNANWTISDVESANLIWKSFRCSLEKRARKRPDRSSFTQCCVITLTPWHMRDFILIGHTLSYYDASKKKGSITFSSNSSILCIDAEIADGKPFPFLIKTDAEEVFLSAPTEELRRKFMFYFNAALLQADWSVDEAIAEEASQLRDREIDRQTRNHLIHEDRIHQKHIKHALQIQCFWRVVIAKCEHKVLVSEKQKKRNNAAVRIQSKVRANNAKIKFRNTVMKNIPQMIIVKILDYSSAVISSQGKSNTALSVYVSGVKTVPIIPGPEVITALPKKNAAALAASSGKLVWYCSKLECTSLLSDTPSMNGQKEALSAVVMNMTTADFIVITLVSKSGFMGQCVAPLSDFPGIFSANSALTATLSLGDFRVPILTSGKLSSIAPNNSKSIFPSDKQAQLTFSIEVIRSAFDISGNLYKLSEKIVSNSFKKRMFILMDGRLHYADDEHDIRRIKYTISCNDISSIKFESEENNKTKDKDIIRIEFKSKGVESFWLLKWDAEMPEHMREKWKRMLYRNCYQLQDPILQCLGRSNRVPRVVDANKLLFTSSLDLETTQKMPLKKRFSLL